LEDIQEGKEMDSRLEGLRIPNTHTEVTSMFVDEGRHETLFKTQDSSIDTMTGEREEIQRTLRTSRREFMEESSSIAVERHPMEVNVVERSSPPLPPLSILVIDEGKEEGGDVSVFLPETIEKST
jgi:hypothetical protein